MSPSDNRLAELFRRYLANTCTRGELEELLAAIENDPANEALRRELEQHWQNSRNKPGIPAAAARLDALLQSAPASVPPSRKRHSPRWWRYAAAAALLAAMATGGYLLFKPAGRQPAHTASHQLRNNVMPGYNKAVLTLANGTTVALDSSGSQMLRQGGAAIHQHKGRLQYTTAAENAAIRYNTLTTPRGGQYELVLSDGTKVWLNAASRVTYPTAFTGRERVVELEGQAYFEITANAQRPFKVKVREIEVLALGTSFDIMAYTDERSLNATLVSGVIKVSAGKADRLLQPGQQAAVQPGSDHISINQVNTEEAIAWKDGYFSFRNTDLPSVMRQLSRWYDVEVKYEGGVPQGTFSGEIGKGLTLAQTLKILEQTRVHFKIEDDKRIVILP
jgi:transmembrane sensor